MWANPKKRAIVEQVAAEIWAENNAKLRAKPPRPAATVEADALLLRGWLAEATKHVEALKKDMFYHGSIADLARLSGAPFSDFTLSMGERGSNVKKLQY